MSVITTLYRFFVEVLPYITIAIFTVGMILRILRWRNAPKDHYSTKINLVESIKYIILDVVLFRKTWKRDKLTWLVLFLFHGSVAGILFGHMRGFKLWSAAIFEPMGHRFADWMVHTLPIYVGWVFLATIVILLIRRIRLENQQLTSLTNDYIAMILLLLASIIGQGMRIFPPEAIIDGTYKVVFIPRLIVLHLETIPSYHWFHWHVLMTQLFVMYTPFSKFIHIISGIISPAIYGSRRKEIGI